MSQEGGIASVHFDVRSMIVKMWLQPLLYCRAHQVNVEMSKTPLRDGVGLGQQAGVAVDLASLAMEAGFYPAGDVVDEAAPDKPRRHRAQRGQPPRMGNAVQMQKISFRNFAGRMG
jgi:hypothetical protein